MSPSEYRAMPVFDFRASRACRLSFSVPTLEVDSCSQGQRRKAQAQKYCVSLKLNMLHEAVRRRAASCTYSRKVSTYDGRGGFTGLSTPDSAPCLGHPTNARSSLPFSKQ